MSDDLKREYIKGLLSVIDEDKKSVLLYVAFDLAVVSLTLSEKIFQSPPKFRVRPRTPRWSLRA